MATIIAVVITILAIVGLHYLELHWHTCTGHWWQMHVHYISAIAAISLGPILVLLIWGLLANDGTMRMGPLGTILLLVLNAAAGIFSELCTRPIDAYLEYRRKQLLTELTTREKTRHVEH